MDMDTNVLSCATSPLVLFAMAILVCNAVFAVCAAKLKDPESFKYSIHMFLGLIFFFGSIVLWSPGYLYHPAEVKGLDLPQNPWIPTCTTFVGILIYMAYHGWKFSKRQIKESQPQGSADESANKAMDSDKE